jgi:fibronectin type 3 domain-containing protein
LSSLSPEAKFKVTPDEVAIVENIQVSFADGTAHLRWVNPLGVELKSIEIYRAQEGGEPTRVTQVNAGSEYYKDNALSSGKTYYYFLKTIDVKGFESKLVGPAGILAR